MNSLYNWQSEVMVQLEMEEVRREMESICLLNDAGLSNPGLLGRTAIAIGKALANLGKRLYENYTDPHQAYQVVSSKYAA